jgi:hypothetical protein
LRCRARNLYEPDDRFVAPPYSGRATSMKPSFPAGARLPTLILHALDDLFRGSYTAIDWSRLPMIETALTQGGDMDPWRRQPDALA